jgi:hypothetical protein
MGCRERHRTQLPDRDRHIDLRQRRHKQRGPGRRFTRPGPQALGPEPLKPGRQIGQWVLSADLLKPPKKSNENYQDDRDRE